MSVLPVTFDVMSYFSTAQEKARLMRAGDEIPASLDAAFDQLGQLDPSWVWVLDDRGTVKGVLIAAPTHGMAAIWRISISPDASNLGLAKLLRQFLKDIRKRNFKGYVTVVSLDSESQARLAKIMERVGAKHVFSGMTVLAGPVPREGI